MTCRWTEWQWMNIMTRGWTEWHVDEQIDTWMKRMTRGWTEWHVDEQNDMWMNRMIRGWTEWHVEKQNDTWMSLNFQQTFNKRCESISIINASMTRIGQNQLMNRMYVLNGKVKHDWMNLTYDVYKIKCKAILLNWWNSKDSHNDDLSKWNDLKFYQIIKCELQTPISLT